MLDWEILLGVVLLPVGEGLQNSPCLDTQECFAGKLRPFLSENVVVVRGSNTY